MNCPVCDGKLREIEKYGVTVDICPGCKGVWLDRGELEKIVQMADADVEPVREGEQSRSPRPVGEMDRRRRDDDYDDDDDRRRPGASMGQEGQRRRRGSWLGDIFESFGGD